MHTDINRCRLKASYQPNMMLAQLGALGLIITAVVGLLVFDRSPNTVEGQLLLFHAQRSSPDGKGADEISWAKEGRMKRLNPFAPTHRGFMGFVNLRPQPAGLDQMNILRPNLHDQLTDAVAEESTDLSFSPEVGKDTGVFFAGYAGTAGDQFPATDDLPILLKSRPVTLIHSVQPQVPPIAKWNDKEGYVEVLLLVDSTGRPEFFSCNQKTDRTVSEPVFELEAVLKNHDRATLEFYVSPGENNLLYVKLQETPEDYHFASYLLKVLPQWKFAPAIRDGKPVSSFVIIQYRFCYDSNPDCQRLLLKSISS